MQALELNLLRVITTLLFTLLTAVRFYFKLKTHTLQESLLPRSEGALLLSIRVALGAPLLAATAMYIFFPRHTAITLLPLPLALHVSGVALALGALALLTCAHIALGENFSTGFQPRRANTLVTHGPYRYIQHPMYTAYFVFFLSIFLITGSWVILLCGEGIILSLMTIRLRREEACLLETYGQTYQHYRSLRRRFIPLPVNLKARPAAKG